MQWDAFAGVFSMLHAASLSSTLHMQGHEGSKTD
jgi:hypothetical protein